MKPTIKFKTLLIGMMTVFTFTTYAQDRVLDELFTNVSVQKNVTYGWNWSVLPTAEDQTGVAFGSLTQYVDSLKMDIYTPDGDAATDRPVILLSHAGSYLPNSLTGVPFGTKEDSTMIELCTRFAKRGFVAISYEYRLGWNPSSPSQETRTQTIVLAVYKAAHDAKALVRYLNANASTYGVDPTKIVLGGSNSGAYHALLAGNLNQPAELGIFKFLDGNGDPMIDTTLWGNFEGNNGALSHFNHPGNPSDFHLVLSLGGCVGDTSWVDAGEVPVIAFHGVGDVGSPFNTGLVTTGANAIPIITVSGPGDYMPLLVNAGNNDAINIGNNCLEYPTPNSSDGNKYNGNFPFYGAGFEPWGWYDTVFVGNPSASRARATAYIDTIVNYFSPRAYKLFYDNTFECTPNSVLNKSLTTLNLDVFPNPTADAATIKLNDANYSMEEVHVYSLSGKLVRQELTNNTHIYSLNRNELESGMYLVKVKLADGSFVNRKLLFN